MYILLLINIGKYKMSKYVKTVTINYEKAEGNFQKGQLGKDKNNNLYRLQGVNEKTGENIWLRVSSFDHVNQKHEAPFKDETKCKAAARKAKRFIRGTVKTPRPSSRFDWGKSSHGVFYNNFQPSEGYNRMRG